MNIRPRFDMGEIEGRTAWMSIQANRLAYCEPRVDRLPLDSYNKVEVALFWGKDWALPSDFGVEGFDHLFEPRINRCDSTVAGYVTQDTLADLKRAINERVYA